jgi:hypothetical protein
MKRIREKFHAVQWGRAMFSHDFAGQTFIRDLSLEQLCAMVSDAPPPQ